jgi:uncharacterized protein YjbI with pentapeptide repeats
MKAWHLSAGAIMMIAQPAIAQTKTSGPVAFAPPAATCLASAGRLGGAGPTTLAVDGKTLKDPSDIKSLRSKARDGRLIVISGGDFSGKKFGSDNFHNICFVGTKLTDTRWVKSKASGIGFIGSDLSGAVFDRVSMDYVLLRNTVMARTDASGAQMSYGQFDGGWEPSVAGLRLENAVMVGFKFVCGVTSSDGCAFDRKKMTLRGANLSSASIASFALWDTQLDDVKLNQTEIGLDQITQFAGANVTGPVLISASNRRIALTPDAFRLAGGAISYSKSGDTECNNPDTPLSQIFCRAGYADLRAYRDDVERLFLSTIPKVGEQQAPGSTIVVSGGNKIHGRYLQALRKCGRKDEDAAVPCLWTAMSKRREMLVSELLFKQPLEADGRALYISAQAPMAQILMRDPRLSSLAPLLVDSSPALLLAYRDEQEQVVARGYGASVDGQRCPGAFGPVGAVTKKRSRRPAAGPVFAVWSSGAEFTLGQPVSGKKKRKPKLRKGQIVDAQAAAPTGCLSLVRSGPLVRVPVTEDDFDRLWASRTGKT